VTERLSAENTAPDTRWVDDEDPFDSDERSNSYPPDSLVTFRFLFNAIRRHARIWIAAAVVGLMGGLAVPVVLPPASASSTKLLLTHREGDDPARAMATDVSMLSTHTIAKRVINRLQLTESPDDLLKQYTVVAVTDRVLQITVGAPTSAEATRLAATLADVYLSFRREQIELQTAPLKRDQTDAQNELTAATAEYQAAGGEVTDQTPRGPAGARFTAAREKLQFIEQQLQDQDLAAEKMNTSRVLDTAAPVLKSKKMALVINVAAGILVGLFLGLGFVVVRALISDRLWRRQDIANTIGSRVPLSIGRPPHWRLRPFPRYLRRSQTEKPAVRLVVRHLRTFVRWGETPKPALAVVGVDDLEACALIVASLAMSYAEEGKRVLAVDLSGRKALARTLGVSIVGTHDSRFSGPDLSLTVFLPEKDTGPAEGRHLLRGEAERSVPDDDPMTQAWANADVILTLAALSPSIGAEHLRTWTAQATAVVTAGKSSTTTVHSVGEMIRLAGIRLVSTVLLRADRTDDSVGAVEGEVLPPNAEAGIEMITR
jgi:capsular polysaccharide biosynthesis protein